MASPITKLTETPGQRRVPRPDRLNDSLEDRRIEIYHVECPDADLSSELEHFDTGLQHRVAVV